MNMKNLNLIGKILLTLKIHLLFQSSAIASPKLLHVASDAPAGTPEPFNDRKESTPNECAELLPSFHAENLSMELTSASSSMHGNVNYLDAPSRGIPSGNSLIGNLSNDSSQPSLSSSNEKLDNSTVSRKMIWKNQLLALTKDLPYPVVLNPIMILRLLLTKTI